MEIGVVGINHNLTPIEIREKFNFSESKRIEASNILKNKLDEIVILSTCNRSEIYYANNEEGIGVDVLIDFYREYFDYENIDDYVFSYTGEDAVRHVYLVAGGLDSIVIGEDQILSQVKDAMEFSLELKFSGKILNRLFQYSLNIGKKVRTKLGISSIPLSTSYIGIQILDKAMGGFENKSALIIGAGEISELSLNYLNDVGLDHLYISNRSDGRLKPLFEKFPNLEKIEYGDRYKVLDKVDILISATGAFHTIIEYEDFPKRDKPIYILDLGLPRDIDEKLGTLDDVYLYTLDDLERESAVNKARRQDLGLRAREIIEEDVVEYLDWLKATKVDPILSSLNDKIAEIEADANNYLNRKLNLSSREKRITEEVINYVLGRITREAILVVKDNPESKNHKEIMAELFDLEV